MAKRFATRIFVLAVAVCALASFTACTLVNVQDEHLSYLEVADYIHEYQELPSNYLTKNEAADMGWTGGNPQNCLGDNVYIGGGRYMNFEGLLPPGEIYYECDVDYYDDTRGTKRLVYTEDGEKIYYTDNHYGETLGIKNPTFDDVFEELY